MGFLDRLFGKKEEEETLVLELEELKPWLERRIREVEEEAVAGSRHTVDEILSSRDAAKEVIIEVRDYEFPPDIKERVYKPVRTSKPAYVKAMLDGLGAIDSRDAASLEDLEEFHTRMLNVMKGIQKTQLGKGRYMTIAFRNQMLEIGSALNSIIDSLTSLGDALKEARKELERLRGIASMAEELKNLVDAREKATERDFRAEIKALKSRRKAEEDGLERLLKSPEYLELSRARERLKKVRERKAAHRLRIVNSIGPFARVFRKYKKLVEDGKGKGDTEILERYLRDPVGTLEEEGPDCRGMKSLLRAVGESVEDGTLKLDEKERGRVLSKIHAETGMLEKLRGELMELIKDEGRLKKALAGSALDERKSALEKELKTLEREIKKLESEEANAPLEADRLQRKAEKLAAEISEKLGEAGVREVRVALPAS